MSKTLNQFGRVLFEELEHIAVRRGGFASLNWVNEKLLEARSAVEELCGEARKRNPELPALKRKADECAQGVRDALAVGAQTAEAVEQLGSIIGDMVKTAQEVLEVLAELSPPEKAP